MVTCVGAEESAGDDDCFRSSDEALVFLVAISFAKHNLNFADVRLHDIYAWVVFVFLHTNRLTEDEKPDHFRPVTTLYAFVVGRTGKGPANDGSFKFDGNGFVREAARRFLCGDCNRGKEKSGQQCCSASGCFLESHNLQCGNEGDRRHDQTLHQFVLGLDQRGSR